MTKVVAFNGSPRKDGNTARLLAEVLAELEKDGIETELVQIGGKKVHGCTACGKCFESRDGKCVIDNDFVNDCIEKMAAADGIVIGSPTYFADVSTETKALIDRAGFVAIANGGMFARKAGAAVVAVRRAGAVHAFDTINHLFGISQMFTVGSSYWNLGLGLDAGDVEKDEEGLLTMRNLGANMAWLLKRIGT
ncbi:NADPH-dependent FMN reductase [Methanofollis liminatans DSM 4140]|uniref:NADPH-dependent FMN reductase n=1 Tax=Methanofollis liminatans DSM 4140 TaxID=28892 RepID=J0SBF9_9EURY|nr:flavodoxin family protein [Methanofollis liminatans]EJG08064.1 NADPH-dependent FMN reductase [Methanofollis liminatans DSM 4140]